MIQVPEKLNLVQKQKQNKQTNKDKNKNKQTKKLNCRSFSLFDVCKMSAWFRFFYCPLQCT
jgi:hypothetical protein